MPLWLIGVLGVGAYLLFSSRGSASPAPSGGGGDGGGDGGGGPTQSGDQTTLLGQGANPYVGTGNQGEFPTYFDPSAPGFPGPIGPTSIGPTPPSPGSNVQGPLLRRYR